MAHLLLSIALVMDESMNEAREEIIRAPQPAMLPDGSLGHFVVGGMRPVPPVLARPATFARRVRIALVIGVLAIGCYTAILSGLAVFFSGAVLTAQHAMHRIVDSGVAVANGGPVVHVAAPSQADIERDSRRRLYGRAVAGF